MTTQTISQTPIEHGTVTTDSVPTEVLSRIDGERPGFAQGVRGLVGTPPERTGQ